MKTLITLFAFIGLISTQGQAQIPPKPVAIPANCDLVSTIDDIAPSQLVDAKHPIDVILISKTKRKIYFMSGGQVTYAFTAAFGDGIGNKISEGDEKTPEGTYSVSSKNTQSDFHKSLGVSYPNASDIAYAKKYKVSPGGAIMIHGMSNKITLANNITVANAINLTDWTQGCVAVRNDQIDAVFPHIQVGTKIEICPHEQRK